MHSLSEDGGYRALRLSFGPFLSLLWGEGRSLTAISQDLETLGYLRREPDPVDRRGVVLMLTPRGTALIGDSVAAGDEFELVIRDMLGAKRLLHLQHVAHDLYHALHLEEEVFEAGSARRATGGPDMGRGGSDIEQLARKLLRRLGRGDAARLAELLKTRVRSTAA